MSLLKKGNRKIIKIIAFDFVGVLVHEKDIDLTDKENKLERMFGPNLCDADYLKEARKIITKDSTIIDNEENISSASEMGITTLKVNRNDDNLFEKIINIVKNAE